MSRAYKIRPVAAFLLALVLAGCATQPRSGAPASSPAAPPAPSAPATVPERTEEGLPEISKEGRSFEVDSNESLLTLLVYRGGPLAKAGHNHVIASHTMNGRVWVPDDPMQASFDIRIPVNELTIDEPELRALEGEDFTSQVSDSAREGTQRNMLSEPMLNGERYPAIGLRSGHMESGSEGVLAQIHVIVRDQINTLNVPLRFTLGGDTLRAQGQFTLKQTQLGLTPFSLFGGALRVEDEVTVKFLLVARAADAQ